jgi:hypothetical protein
MAGQTNSAMRSKRTFPVPVSNERTVAVAASPKGPDGGSEGDMQRCQARRIAEAEVLVADMSRIDNGADHPGRQTPEEYAGSHKRSEANVNGQVHGTGKKRPSKPAMPDLHAAYCRPLSKIP